MLVLTQMSSSTEDVSISVSVENNISSDSQDVLGNASLTPCAWLDLLCICTLHEVCWGRAHVQNQVVMHELCMDCGCAQPSMLQVSLPASRTVLAPPKCGVNALNTSGTLTAMMKNVLFAGIGVLTSAKTALQSLCVHCPKYFWIHCPNTLSKSAFVKYPLFYIYFFFLVFSSLDRFSAYAMIVLVDSGSNSRSSSSFV